jgi:hypothetical protein
VSAARKLTLHTPGDPRDDVREDPNVEATDQVCDALDVVDRPAEAFLRWPFRELDALTGGMAPGDVWYACAFSGNGKTTFLSSAIDLWFEQGKKVYVLPLETRPKVFRTYWACQRLGIHPGEVLSGAITRWADHTEVRKRIRDELHRQVEHPMIDRVRVKSVPAINVARLSYAVAEASEWGADVVIVDHIDHIAGGDGSSLYTESVKVNRAAEGLAQDHEIALLCASQLNNDMLRGSRDRLAQFGPPMPHHVFMGGHKRQVCTGMIGLHRKLREKRDGEDAKAYKAAIQEARTGDDPMGMLEPNVMGVTAMKLRNYGARENQRVHLGVEHGRAHSIAERDQHGTTREQLRNL